MRLGLGSGLGLGVDAALLTSAYHVRVSSGELGVEISELQVAVVAVDRTRRRRCRQCRVRIALGLELRIALLQALLRPVGVVRGVLGRAGACWGMLRVPPGLQGAAGAHCLRSTRICAFFCVIAPSCAPYCAWVGRGGRRWDEVGGGGEAERGATRRSGAAVRCWRRVAAVMWLVATLATAVLRL